MLFRLRLRDRLKTVADVAALGIGPLMRQKNFSRSSAAEVADMLRAAGYELRFEEPGDG